MKRLDLVSQGQDFGILCVRLTVDPLSEDTGGRVRTAGKFSVSVESVTQIAGPFVMSCLSVLHGVQQ